MPPPQQDKDVARDYRFLKLILTDVKKSGGLAVIINNSCKTQVSDGTATFLPSLEGRGSKWVGENIPSSGTMCHLLPHRGEGIKEILKRVQHDMFNFLIRTYSHIHLFTYSHRKRPAFTLAEVLITLGIIGVVAAMTMPVLIQGYTEKATVAKLKKVYSNLNNALIMSINEYGELNGWGITSSDIDNKGADLIAKRIKEFMISAKDCNFEGGCFGEEAYKTLGPANEAFFGLATNFSTLVLSDGVSIGIWAGDGYNSYGSIIVDLNGKKKPNTTGKDAFWFRIKEHSIVPYGLPEETGNNTFGNCVNPVNYYYTSRGCTAWVIFNENMDYLHCKDLSWEGKKECK